MKEDHKKIIEDVILEFKKDPNGKMYTDNFARILEDHNLRLFISKMLIEDFEFVEKWSAFSRRDMRTFFSNGSIYIKTSGSIKGG